MGNLRYPWAVEPIRRAAEIVMDGAAVPHDRLSAAYTQHLALLDTDDVPPSVGVDLTGLHSAMDRADLTPEEALHWCAVIVSMADRMRRFAPPT